MTEFQLQTLITDVLKNVDPSDYLDDPSFVGGFAYVDGVWQEDPNTAPLTEQDEIVNLSTFDEAGLLTRDKGVVVQLASGAQFQVTIVQSRQGRAS